jgi:hypothetical protein
VKSREVELKDPGSLQARNKGTRPSPHSSAGMVDVCLALKAPNCLPLSRRSRIVWLLVSPWEFLQPKLA